MGFALHFTKPRYYVRALHYRNDVFYYALYTINTGPCLIDVRIRTEDSVREDVHILQSLNIAATATECRQECDIVDKGYSLTPPFSFDGERREAIPVHHVRYDEEHDRWRIIEQERNAQA